MATISTTPKPTYVYDTTTDTWYPVGSVALANMRTYEFTATQGQTTFSGSDNNSVTLDYIPGNVMVFLNGIAIVPGEDYTATNGTSIVLTEAASLNDVLTVNAFAGFHLSDTYTQSEINTRLADKADEAQLGQRNMIHNGAMQVHQRGTSATGITTTGYYTADRFRTTSVSSGTWTQTVENDGPSGSGLRKSLKMLCTTANTSLSSNSVLQLDQIFEGQDLQRIAKGTSSAKQLTLSFWVKSNVTGTYVVELYDNDNSRQVSKTYTLSSSETWERKTIIYPSDLTGQFDNDTGNSMRVSFFMVAGTNYTSDGTLNTEWSPSSNSKRGVGQTNLAAATNNYWQITGVQLEVGSEATPFEFEDYGTTLRKCQRYFEKTYNVSDAPGTATIGGFVGVGGPDGVANTYLWSVWRYKVDKRINPNVTLYDMAGNIGRITTWQSGSTVNNVTPTNANWQGNQSSHAVLHQGSVSGYYYQAIASADL